MNARLPRLARQRGFTLVELMIAAVISTIVGFGLVSLMDQSTKFQRSVFRQQISLLSGKKVSERLNREIRLATKDMQLQSPVGNFSNEVRFNYYGEIGYKHSFRLDYGDDKNYATANDNILYFYPNVDDESSRQILTTMISAYGPPGTSQADMVANYLNTGRCFSYGGSQFDPLNVRLRTGDPIDITPATEGRGATKNAINNNNFTGKGVQGVDINISVTPRNPVTPVVAP